MKRSEMLRKIEALLYWNRNVADKEKAEAILNHIEELGMQAPVMPGVYDNVPTVTPTGNHEYSWKRGWEDETQ